MSKYANLKQKEQELAMGDWVHLNYNPAVNHHYIRGKVINFPHASMVLTKWNKKYGK